MLLMHGTADWRVNPLDSIHMAEKLYKNKIPYKLVVFDGADHGLTEYKSESNRLMLEWFDRFVKNSEPLPSLKPHGK
jgi:dipeptidyl aminopeptidase/acylaminoacyl peptidase